MLSLFVTLLTIVLVLDCFMLTLLILMQLPKKEAGLGQAFGSSATDALFGAGSGNVLTKTTRYAASVFFVLSIVLSILGPRANEEKRRLNQFERGTSDRTLKSTAPAPLQPLTPSSNLLSAAAITTNTAATQITNLIASNLPPAEVTPQDFNRPATNK